MEKRIPTAAERSNGRQSRLVAIVMAATILLWMGAQVVGGKLGLDPRYAFLVDFAAIAAFIWVLVNVWQIWRNQSASGK